MSNVYEKRARTRKVRKMCKAAREIARNIDTTNARFADLLESASDIHWYRLTRYAGVPVASSETRRRVVTALKRYDKERGR